MTDLNRPDLWALLGQRVTITNQAAKSSWTGKLLGFRDEPCMAIGQDNGDRICLPQSFTITRADDTPPDPVAPWERELLERDWQRQQAVTTALAEAWPELAEDPAHLDQMAAVAINALKLHDHASSSPGQPGASGPPRMAPEPPPKPNAQWERLAIQEPNGDVTYTWPNVPPTADIVTGARVHGLLDRQLDRLAETLFNSIERLEQHIDQRAAEVAQPLIAKAREAALTDIERARREQQRAEDLSAELRRQLKALDWENQTARQGRDAANATVACVRELHASMRYGIHGDQKKCKHCSTPWPCATIRALDGEEVDGG